MAIYIALCQNLTKADSVKFYSSLEKFCWRSLIRPMVFFLICLVKPLLSAFAFCPTRMVGDPSVLLAISYRCGKKFSIT